MKKIFAFIFLVFALTSCQHLIHFVDMTSNVKQNKIEVVEKPKKTLYYTFRVLDKKTNFIYVEQFRNPKTFFYRDVSNLEVLDTLQWASETSYYN